MAVRVPPVPGPPVRRWPLSVAEDAMWHRRSGGPHYPCQPNSGPRVGGRRRGRRGWRPRPGDGPELGLGDARRGDGVVGEGGEAAVRREEHAIGAEELDGALGPRDDLVRRLDRARASGSRRRRRSGSVARQVRQDVELAGARRAELEEERADRRPSRGAAGAAGSRPPARRARRASSCRGRRAARGARAAGRRTTRRSGARRRRAPSPASPFSLRAPHMKLRRALRRP